jgi:hypothetical protein
MTSEEFEKMHLNAKEQKYLFETNIVNKANYYYDINEVTNTWSGRLDVIFSNVFFKEAEKLIINSIVLFEKGFFDSAFYSLRQSIEVSLTIAFFADNESLESQKEWIKKWKNKEIFPMLGQMSNTLKNLKKSYSDIKEKIPDFFSHLKELSNKINKYIHKQGYDTFYKSRSVEDLKNLLDDFIAYLEISISAIAIHRLVIDPFPILLTDEEIYYRSGDTLSEAFSDSFINKYLSQYIDQYKKTELYLTYYDFFITKEKPSSSVLLLLKEQYFDRSKFEEYISQVNLLSLNDRVVMNLFTSNIKISKIFIGIGFHFYFSDVKSKRISYGFNSEDLQKVKDSNSPLNSKYEEAFLSYFKICAEDYYIEHNEILNSEEIHKIKILILVVDSKFNDLNDF